MSKTFGLMLKYFLNTDYLKWQNVNIARLKSDKTMKQKSALLILMIAVAANISCKKNNVESPPMNPPPPPSPIEKKWLVTTVAGDGSASLVNGPSLSAAFHFPEDVVVAANGTIYVTDIFNRVLRKIAAGQVSTLAGGVGFDIIDGNGASAGFKSPYSITIDANGNLYTSDDNDPRVRKISSIGEVLTYAGIGTPGFADGNKDVAQFKSGNYIIADALGNLYISDAGNNRIRKISVSGQVTTIAGTGIPGHKDGSVATAQFNFPGGVTIDQQGNLYIIDRGNFRIRKITPAGEVSTVAGSGVQGDKDGNSGEAQFNLDTRDIAIDDLGNLYLSDRDRIRKINPEGIVSTIAGSTSGYNDGDGTSAKFNFPNGLGIDTQGKIYVADLNNNRIRKLSFE